ncbi:MAG: VCBS repeat-containing protein, partial [Planctomycetes bacterium]|nr:VCBS repeat-containing protein [Planctomycetota bacterium]
MLHASLARGAPSGRRLPLAFTLLAASLACAGCTRGPKGPTSAAPPPKVALPAAGEGFTDVTAASGIDFVHSFGDLKFSNLVEAVGSGAAWLDYDGDGWIDVYIATGKHQSPISTGKAPARKPLNRLYRNRGDGTLEDVTERAGVGCPSGYSMGVAAGDYDNDGRPDIYVCNHGPNVLYRNRGDGTFEDATERAGVGDPRCSAAATWLDYDLDGWIDLYVGNYIRFDPKYNLYYAPDGFPGPLAYAPDPDRLYRNRGDGTFEDVTAKAGIRGGLWSVAAGWFDYDNDGFLDLFIVNYLD